MSIIRIKTAIHHQQGRELHNYSSKAVALFGDSRAIKHHFKAIGGKFNDRLTHPVTRTKQSGWIFPNKVQDKVILLLN